MPKGWAALFPSRTDDSLFSTAGTSSGGMPISCVLSRGEGWVKMLGLVEEDARASNGSSRFALLLDADILDGTAVV